MKLAIFENEYASVKGAFNAANLIHFGDSISIELFQSSQKADFEKIHEYSVIFVDIDLSSKSELDGFGVINKIISINDELLSRIVILTGNNRITEVMKIREVYDTRIQILIKPTDYEEITKCIKNIKSCS